MSTGPERFCPQQIPFDKGMVEIRTKEYLMLDGSKKLLVQQVGDGSIIKRFEKTPYPSNPTDIVCPHFLELKWAYGCPYDCAWCYLQGTLRYLPGKKKPVEKDRRKVALHLLRFFDYEGPPELLNSGELADSLMSERTTQPFSKFILPLFESQSKHKILFVTKSTHIENLLRQDNGRAIVSFSLNAEEVARRWERAPSVSERIRAAAELHSVGYDVRIRVDPVVPYGDWRRHYSELIDRLFDRFKPERITLGSLRGLRSTIREARDRSWCRYLGEESSWGLKVPFPLRYEMYRFIIDYLRREHGYRAVALCKETRRMWDELQMDYRGIKCNCML